MVLHYSATFTDLVDHDGALMALGVAPSTNEMTFHWSVDSKTVVVADSNQDYDYTAFPFKSFSFFIGGLELEPVEPTWPRSGITFANGKVPGTYEFFDIAAWVTDGTIEV